MRWKPKLQYPPFTLNDHYFSSYRDKYRLQYYKSRPPGECDGCSKLLCSRRTVRTHPSVYGDDLPYLGLYALIHIVMAVCVAIKGH